MTRQWRPLRIWGIAHRAFGNWIGNLRQCSLSCRWPARASATAETRHLATLPMAECHIGRVSCTGAIRGGFLEMSRPCVRP